MADVIAVEGLVKRFGATVALDGLSLRVPEGTLLGVLGPNGAGKTTAVRILATLLRPDAGRASVLGMDVVRDADRVRHVIGLTGQYAAVDELLTGRENLVMVGRLFRLGRAEARRRSGELLEQFGLSEAANRPVRTYSGGMRRRLDIAASLIARPRVLFLDEPTTGLDPRSRIGMWEVIEDLVGQGTTMLLTTQYLDEADRLATAIAVIDHGRVIAQGTSDQLKDQVGGVRLEVTVADRANLDQAVVALKRYASGELTVDAEVRNVVVPVSTQGAGFLPGVVRDLDAAGVAVDDLALRRPTLDDVFFSLTGHAAQDGGPGTGTGGDR
ncbi:MAG TPA: ATP-binding cassette domain-containing protein [Mycobacteriales bacterium]|nr:ATP-binding cassette domain-containing protein [Mycobacteriales bacterium]